LAAAVFHNRLWKAILKASLPLKVFFSFRRLRASIFAAPE
jgi:hypothetical protein